MKLQIFSVRDIAADVYDRPFFAVSIGAARRGFGDAVNTKDNPLAAHPEDYELYHLGIFDDNAATFDLLPRPQQIATGSELVRRS